LVEDSEPHMVLVEHYVAPGAQTSNATYAYQFS
jgi:hypothetical protein